MVWGLICILTVHICPEDTFSKYMTQIHMGSQKTVNNKMTHLDAVLQFWEK